MKMQSFYPVLLTPRLAETAAFYCRHFGFVRTFESDWYVSLATQGPPRCHELALLQPGHPSIPVPLAQATGNLILNIEVEEVDGICQRLIAGEGLPQLLALRDEPWGQRHFITQDPNGILIDVIQTIPPTEEFLRQYNLAPSTIAN